MSEDLLTRVANSPVTAVVLCLLLLAGSAAVAYLIHDLTKEE